MKLGIIFLSFLLVAPSCQFLPKQSASYTPSDRISLIIDQQGNISHTLNELLRLTGLKPVITLTQAIPATQSHWLRKPGLERQHLLEENAERKPIILDQFNRLGFIEEVSPKGHSFDYVMLLGAMYKTITLRLSFLETLIKNGITGHAIVLLGSDRPLEKQEIDGIARDYGVTNAKTEIEMMELLWSRSKVLNTQIKSMIRIASPMKPDGKGGQTRANTKDTIEDFIKLKPKPGSVLVTSSQPYVLRQGLIVSSLLKPPFIIETVGQKAPPQLPTSVYLDELARALYELEKSKGGKS